MFGKSFKQYLEFSKVFVGLLLVVGLVRLGLSLAGLPNTIVKWVPMNAVLWAGFLYFGVKVHTTGFGSYPHLLPLVVLQLVPFHGVAVLGILLAIAGFPNIFAAPEYSFPGGHWVHILSHLTIGMVMASLVGWGVGCLVLLITRKSTSQPVAT